MGRKSLIAAIILVIVAIIGSYLIFNSTMSESKARALVIPENNSSVSVSDSTGTMVPEKLNLPIPKEETGSSKVISNQALTLFLLKDDKVFAYKGKKTNTGKVWKLASIGTLLAQEKMLVGDSLVVFLVPSKFATYSSTVGLLDELSKSGIRNYTLHDATKDDELFIEKKQQEESK